MGKDGFDGDESGGRGIVAKKEDKQIENSVIRKHLITAADKKNMKVNDKNRRSFVNDHRTATVFCMQLFIKIQQVCSRNLQGVRNF